MQPVGSILLLNMELSSNRIFEIAGFRLGVSSDCSLDIFDELDGFEAFEVSGDMEPDGRVLLMESLQGLDFVPAYTLEVDGGICRYGKVDKTHVFQLTPNSHNEEPLWVIYDNGGVVRCSFTRNLVTLRFLLWVAFNFYGLRCGIVAMHSSCVRYKGYAVLFLGESGTGKSTHTRLWYKNFVGARLLNDDSPLLRFKEGRLMVYGSPWSGKTPCYFNESYPVAAVVRLSQAPKNEMYQLGVIESIAALKPSMPPALSVDPFYGEKEMDMVTAIIQNVKVYRLDCLPDIEAARLCRSNIFPQYGSLVLPNQLVFMQVEDNISRGQQIVIPLVGNSMSPTVVDGDKVQLSPIADRKKLKIGDVVLFRYQGRHILHRIIKIKNDEYILQGDAMTKREHVMRDDIVALLTAVEFLDGTTIQCDSDEWKRRSRFYLVKKKLKHKVKSTIKNLLD